MISEKQLAANRSNAQHSTGPRTEEGKRNSSLNARRHNLTGQVTAMTEEDRVAHDEFSAALIASMAPEGALELQLAQRVATDSWRLNRSSAIEDNLFAIGFSEHADEITSEHPEVHAAFVAARVFTVESKHLELLTLYEQRINRSLQKNLSLLQTLQAARKEQRRHEIEEAKKLLQLNERKGLPYDPAKDGFVFSNDEIHAAVDRERRLERAQHLDLRRNKHQKQHAHAA
ncbi:MAG: hypothetical protein ABSG41_03515 [Bryobacteraceae bacterium]|jgi:hypothetical protein